MKGFGFGLIEGVTTLNNPFDNQFVQYIKMNRWSSIIVESGLFCVYQCSGIGYTMLVIEVVSLICSSRTANGVTTSTVVAFPSILAVADDFLAVDPNI